ncbi:hypothetical protein [Paenibacillus thermotolerans]|uniref:hypothetical protein n=1 Tax=Paenibacillus thermotolerans TaxID=3027807 RepID=UPI0023688AAA|nr:MULTISPECIES: hypothetical protein [unclassified Paenibacillus]
MRAAFGKVIITPEERSPLQGYDPEMFSADPATDTLDDLYARILIVDDGHSRSVILSIDCCLTNEEAVQVPDPTGGNGPNREFIPTFPPGTREAWARAGGTAPNAITVNATHTHTAPACFGEKDTRRIEEAIRETTERLAPVTLSAAAGESGISAFRRPALKADRSVPVNQSLRMLIFETSDGKLAGAVANYAVHPTAVRNPVSRISGDIVGLAVSQVEEHVGEDFVCLFLQGFSGDICPLYGDNGPAHDTYSEVKTGSLVLAGDILRTLSTRTPVEVSGLRADMRTIRLPAREGFYIEHCKVTLVGIALGPALILSVSGEMFNDYISKLDSISPFAFNLFSGVSNGYSGYIPTRKAFLDGLGGYEMNTTPYTPEAEEYFLREAEDFIGSLCDR